MKHLYNSLPAALLVAMIWCLPILAQSDLALAQSSDDWVDWSAEDTAAPKENENALLDESQNPAPAPAPAPTTTQVAPTDSAATSSLGSEQDMVFWPQDENGTPGTATAPPSSLPAQQGQVFYAGDPMAFSDPAPSFEAAVAASDIEVTYEAISISPILNVTAGADPKVIIMGESVEFLSQWNYSPWIKFGEIRVFRSNQSYYETPVEILEVGHNLKSTWKTTEIGDYFYVLRVYDGAGHFDETIPKTIRVVTSATATALSALDNEDYDPLEQIYDKDYTRNRNIPLFGGMVTVYGKHVPEGQSVHVFNRVIPVGDTGEFVAQEIFPPGTHDINVEYHEDAEIVRQMIRDVSIGEAQWSYVFLGDLVVGENLEGGPVNLSNQMEPEFDDIYINGRAALYVNGRFKEKYKLTARADTGYEALEDLLRNIDEKDPQYLFRRLDPGENYPVYADESTAVNMTPSQGKIYFRIENGDTYAMWGNYATGSQDTEFAQVERGLYGAKVNVVGVDTTKWGERKYKLQGFAAEPGTLPAREEFRGTGGSAYLLQHQDLTIGSERIRVEIRDRETGLPKETVDLQPREDYDIDYIQGRILLNHPLSSYTNNAHYVRTGNASGDTAYLIVHYEHTPTISDFDGWSIGGRASAWLNDHLQVGMAGYSETSAGTDKKQYAADITFRRSPATYIRGDFVRTLGTGFGAVGSNDGGFSFDDLASGLAPDSAKGWRLEGGLDGVDVGLEQDQLRVSGFFEHRDPFLSNLGRFTKEDTDQWGINLSSDLTDTTQVRATYSEIELSEETASRDITVDLEQELGFGFNAGLGYRLSHRVRETLLGPSTMEREDAAVQLEYDPGTLWTAYAFGQTTINKTDEQDLDNERIGLGTTLKIAERFELGGEASSGDGGLGGRLTANFRTHEGSEYYLGYQIDPDRTDTGISDIGPYGVANEVITLGTRLRYSEHMSIFGEERYQSGDRSVGITHTYGIDFTPTDSWRISGGIETGDIEFDDGSILDRDALSVTVGYNDELYTFASNFEAREDASHLETRDTYISRTMLDVNGYENWRFTGRVNWMNSRSSKGEFFDGDFLDVTMGYGYRPVYNDRLNFLVKYTYFMDLPGSEQITPSGLTADYKQKSQIFVGDLNYDVTPRVTLGFKYGLRVGEITSSRITDDFFDSRAQLGVVRLDWHVVRKWDFLAEQRILHTDVGDMTRTGSLFALYRHLGDHLKFGVGYNFADFSERLTNISYDDEGYFVNLVTKY